MSIETLEILIEGCLKQHSLSQEAIYNHYYSLVLGVSLRYASSKEEGKELTNDAFFKAFTKIQQFEKGSNFEAWLYQIARNNALDFYRSLLNKPITVSDEYILENHTENLEKQIIDRFDIHEKLQFVQQLPPVYRMVFNLFVVDGFTHEEIAETLHISIGTSKSNLSKSRAFLRSILEKNLKSKNTFNYEQR
jgi:RNA polymerase sigma factor (sigma-70 family)